MEAVEIRSALQEKLENLPEQQLKEIYGLVINYLNSKIDSELYELTDAQKMDFEQGLKEAAAGLWEPLSEINKGIRQKYNLND